MQYNTRSMVLEMWRRVSNTWEDQLSKIPIHRWYNLTIKRNWSTFHWIRFRELGVSTHMTWSAMGLFYVDFLFYTARIFRFVEAIKGCLLFNRLSLIVSWGELDREGFEVDGFWSFRVRLNILALPSIVSSFFGPHVQDVIVKATNSLRDQVS